MLVRARPHHGAIRHRSGPHHPVVTVARRGEAGP